MTETIKGMPKNIRWALLSLVLALAALLRFSAFTATPGLFSDEAMNGNNAVEALESGHFQVFYPENNGREGLYPNLVALSIAITGSHEPWVVRIPSPFIGVLTVWGTYLLAAELFDAPTGLLAAFFLATSLWHLIFSRLGFRVILAPFFLVWALWLLLRTLHSAEGGSTKRTRWLAIATGVVYGLGFYSYLSYRITPLLLFVFLLPYFHQIRGLFRILRDFLLASFVVVLPLILYFFFHPAEFMGRTSQLTALHAPNPVYAACRALFHTAIMFHFMGDRNWRHNIAGQPELTLIVGVLFLLGIILTLRSVLRPSTASYSSPFDEPRHRQGRLLVLWLAIGLIPVALSTDATPHAIRALIVLPACMILAAQGGLWLYRRLLGRFPESAVNFFSFLSLVTILTLVVTDYFFIWIEAPETAAAFRQTDVDLARYLNSTPFEGERYILVDSPEITLHGLPVPAQTVLFVAHAYTPADAAAAHLHFLPKNEEDRIPALVPSTSRFMIRSGEPTALP